MKAPVIVLMLLRLGICASRSDQLIFAVEHDCRQTACFDVWRPDEGGRLDVAVVTNGLIRSSPSDESNCSLPVYHLEEDTHRCTGREVRHSSPRQHTSLQCVLLGSSRAADEGRTCRTPAAGLLKLRWVYDGGENPVEGSSGTTRRSDCDVTLTVSLRRPGNASFRCQAEAGGRTWTSEKTVVHLLPRRTGSRGLGNGRRPRPEVISDGEGAAEAERPLVVGPTVGVLGAVLLVAAALFVLNKRRTNSPAPRESPTSTADCADLDSDEVIYADVLFPAASGRVCVPEEEETTVYATVRCT